MVDGKGPMVFSPGLAECPRDHISKLFSYNRTFLIVLIFVTFANNLSGAGINELLERDAASIT